MKTNIPVGYGYWPFKKSSFAPTMESEYSSDVIKSIVEKAIINDLVKGACESVKDSDVQSEIPKAKLWFYREIKKVCEMEIETCSALIEAEEKGTKPLCDIEGMED